MTCIEYLQQATSKLGTPIPALEAERLAFYIAEVMSTRNREFHNLEHAVTIGTSENPIAQLAGIFHDVVYIQIDRARTYFLREAFAPCEISNDLTLDITPKILENPDVSLVALLFGINVGQTIGTHQGLNEFLSALSTFRWLKPYLNPADLIGVINAIEATIPFRYQVNDDLHQTMIIRMKEAAVFFKTELTIDQLKLMVHSAVEVANRDVMGFTAPDPSLFIQDTWALLYEANSDLQKRFYSLNSYLHAVNGMDQFFQKLSHTSILRQFENVPEQSQYQKMVQRCEFNVSTGRQYTAIKLVEVALLNAVAECTGGTVPADFFYGAKSSDGDSHYESLENHLTIPREINSSDGKTLIHKETYKLLIQPRSKKSKFDNKTSYLAAFLISNLKGEAELSNLYFSAKEYAASNEHALGYLAHFGSELLLMITQAIARIAPSRAEELQSLRERIEQYRASNKTP